MFGPEIHNYRHMGHVLRKANKFKRDCPFWESVTYAFLPYCDTYQSKALEATVFKGVKLTDLL